MDSRKSSLNLPAGMESSLRLNTIPTHFPSIPKTPSPSKTTYSDRFIPLRSASRLQNFALVEKSSPVKEGGNEAYSRLLRTELFGADSVPCSPAGQGSPMSPSKNLFRFKTDHSAPNSPLSAVISGQDGGGSAEASMPPKVPRKIPKTAYKVPKTLLLLLRESSGLTKIHKRSLKIRRNLQRKRKSIAKNGFLIIIFRHIAGSGRSITSR